MQKSKFLPAVMAAFLIGGAIVYLLAPPMQNSRQQAKGEALIGGPFTLVNHKGLTVTDADFRGKFMLVYFGYTFCPDVCPNELGVISQALDDLGSAAEKITPVFITVDPERDSVAQLAEYVDNFHKSLVGLTGTPEQIKTAAKAYRVYYARPDTAKAKADESGSTPSAKDEDYVMDHSSITFLMGPDGKYVSHFAYGTKPDVMTEKLRSLVR